MSLSKEFAVIEYLKVINDYIEKFDLDSRVKDKDYDQIQSIFTAMSDEMKDFQKNEFIKRFGEFAE